MRLMIKTGVLVGLLLLVAVPAAAQYEPPDGVAQPTVEADVTAVAPGGAIRLCGGGWLDLTELTHTLLPGGEVLGTTTTGADGSFCTTLTISSDVAPGTYTIRTTGLGADGNARTVDTAITVRAATAAPTVDAAPSGLVATGLELTTGIILVTLLVLTGGLALVIARRRSAAS